MRQVLGPGALGRPRGIGWRERWEGGSGWGIHVTPWLIHVNVWQNPLKCCEVISLQLIKINEKKKNKKKKKRREAKGKGEKKRYIHLNAEFQRIARRDKKAYLSEQCNEVEENNRMGKTGDLFKKIRYTKGTFHAKMSTIKDRYGPNRRGRY